MLNDPTDLAVGAQAWLFPQSKVASANCHRQLPVRILKDLAAHWPMVVVGWKEDGVEKWELVHRDNIRKRAPGAISSKSEKTQGDSIGDRAVERKGRVRVMPSARKYAPGEGQETLF